MDPKIVSTAPGAKPCPKLAPLVTLETAGVAVEPNPDEVTLTARGALVELLYVAVTAPLPTGNCRPLIASVAVAVPADPVNGAVPRLVLPMENETDPEGVVPFEEVTVAVKYTVSFVLTDLKLAVKVIFELEDGGGVVDVMVAPLQASTNLFASTEPSPVVWSYPGPA